MFQGLQHERVRHYLSLTVSQHMDVFPQVQRLLESREVLHAVITHRHTVSVRVAKQLVRAPYDRGHVRTRPVLGGVGAGGGVLGLHEAERAWLRVVAARLQLHLAAEVLVQPLLPALRGSMPNTEQ